MFGGISPEKVFPGIHFPGSSAMEDCFRKDVSGGICVLRKCSERIFVRKGFPAKDFVPGKVSWESPRLKPLWSENIPRTNIPREIPRGFSWEMIYSRRNPSGNILPETIFRESLSRAKGVVRENFSRGIFPGKPFRKMFFPHKIVPGEFPPK